MFSLDQWPVWGLFLFGLQVLGILHAVHALYHVRTPQGTIAWILILVTLPFPAIPLYWIFGRNRFTGYVVSRRAEKAALDGLLEESRRQPDFDLPAWPAETEQLEYLAELTGFSCTAGNALQVHAGGEKAFAAMLDDIASAEAYILIQFFIIKDGELASRFLQALSERVQAGVKVYFVYDEFGSRKLSRAYVRRLEQAGIACNAFRTTRGWGNAFQLNFRNHRKITVVDGRVGYVGGLNLGDEYIGKGKRLRPWRDTHVRVEGPSVLHLQTAFVEDWYWARSELPDIRWTSHRGAGADHPVIVVPTGPADERPVAQVAVLTLIAEARERLWIASPYFVPDDAVAAALRVAALRGVDVRIMLPQNPDHYLVYLASFSYYREMLSAGVRLYRYQPGFMHQKVTLVDDRLAAVGTMNLDNRSLYLNFEVTLIIPDRGFAGEVGAMLEDDFGRCHEARIEDLTRRSWLFHAAVRGARLLAPVL